MGGIPFEMVDDDNFSFFNCIEFINLYNDEELLIIDLFFIYVNKLVLDRNFFRNF